MMKTEAVQIATYFVVPIIPFGGSTQNVLYYEQLPNLPKWTRVDPKKLNARGQGCNANQILVYQPAIDTIIARTDLGSDVLDHSVNLYAGVAKTLGDSDSLPSMFPMGSDGTLVIPVTAETVRGLILVFTKTGAAAELGARITQLIASPDPEIKNSTGG